MKRYEPQKEEIISAGIDIGTSTTKVVISKFSLMNMAGGTHMPRIEIIDKEIIHRSPIHRTPLTSSTTIDIEAVERIVALEYEKAGIQISDIQTGAVIITGETATKHNAEQMIHQLSNNKGEFLVATAGPDLEGIIAAKGSGAYTYAKKTGKTIANIDIGGGTANVAVYRAEKLYGTCTLHIGGRLIEFKDGMIMNLSKPVKRLAEHKGLSLTKGQHFDNELKEITHFMADVIARMLKNQLTDEDKILLLGHEPTWDQKIDAIMFSGGIGECIHKLEANTAQEDHFDDIGMLLAASLKENLALKEWEWIIPTETVRATVLGAGTQTTEISGATIQVEGQHLPLKNLPVYQICFDHDFEKGIEKIAQGMEEAIEIYDPAREGINFALHLTEIPYIGFRHIQKLAASILEALKIKPKQDQPLVIVLESDHAKVLGQTIKVQKESQSVICIDQIQVVQGDYLDIGRVLQTGVVPVIVKTLTFHT
ncbi:ethanolamine ammonia-lyase reactivating factor EutA [Cytobacillus sp. S13-E01]|uniref:ethanolamine ammonia-lyase reactivating factor EutA n=1 Tax=Cytobacillus sp. S13-E01 TaxID=3031326 RepID=UPI0023D877D2|nr:ethanolamine ammonia-lyase reactivating factor EutA [Cytobacillus sp. S13-E01]MDF0725990.1 ethanolamine ammonia-lyase reactivating factor EutA [Cytobacillus sp. S13-E01]